MENIVQDEQKQVAQKLAEGTVLPVLLALSFTHLLNDTLQSLIPSIYPLVKSSQLYLFAFLFAVAAGTFIGGPLGDRIGRKYVIWISILGVAPFTLLMPHVDLFWTCVLSIFIGVILASAFSAILVYAQELMPGKVGMIAGLFFGFAFGIAGIGSALLGELADRTSINYVYNVCSWLPLIGLLTGLLPNLERRGKVKG